MIATPKKYFRLEKVRNQDSAALFERMIKHAFGAHNAVIIGHHLTFEDTRGSTEENILTENEIPSADTLIFDHEIMEACFGADAIMIMQALASVRTELRDKLLAEHWKMYGPGNRASAKHEAQPTPSGNYAEKIDWYDRPATMRDDYSVG